MSANNIALSELRTAGQIGGFCSASGCTVFKGEWGQRPVAIKQYDIQPDHLHKNYHARKPAFDAEIALLRVFGRHNPNVIQLLGHCDINLRFGEEKLWVVTEYGELGNLWLTFTPRSRPLPWPHVRKIVLGVANGLRGVHALDGHAHRRLSPSSVVLTTDWTPKLIDFNQHQRDETRFSFGDPNAFFIAPEILDRSGTEHPANVDKYSFALLTLYLLTHKPPDRHYTASNVDQQRATFEEWWTRNKYIGVDDELKDRRQLFEALNESVFSVDPAKRSDIGTVADCF